MIFWHKFEGVNKDVWHAYNQAGHSLCGDYALLGRGRPADATARMPSRYRSKVCAECEKNRPRLDREAAKK